MVRRAGRKEVQTEHSAALSGRKEKAGGSRLAHRQVLDLDA